MADINELRGAATVIRSTIRENSTVLIERLARRQATNIIALCDEIERLREALKPFANIPTHGAYGGPLVAGHVWYEDGSSGCGDAKYAPVHGAIINRHDLARARKALEGGE